MLKMKIGNDCHGNQFLNDGINFTPQATAVKLAQLGEGDSPQCGEMSA